MSDTKISDLTALTSMSDDDLLVVVDAPASTPVTKNITYANFRAPLVTLTGTETLTDKTLTLPQIDYIKSSGYLYDSTVLKIVADVSGGGAARCYLVLTNSYNSSPSITTIGSPDDVGLIIGTKGTGTIKLKSGSSTTYGHTVPNVADDTVALIDATQTLTNKTLTAPVLGAATATSINKVTITAPATSATLTLATGSSLITSGAYAITFTATNTTNVTLPTTGTLATLAGTETFTNKRITQRVVTTTDDATAVIDCDVTDQYQLSAIANATEFTVTGTPTDGQKLIIRYKDAGVAKGLTFTGFTALGVTIPTTTTAGKWGYVGAIYNLAATTWHVLAVNTEA